MYWRSHGTLRSVCYAILVAAGVAWVLIAEGGFVWWFMVASAALGGLTAILHRHFSGGGEL